MRVVGISGSPRRGGNTETLLREVLRGAEAAGGEARLLALSDMKIAPCRGCHACSVAGHCTTADDMELIYQEIEALDALVLASPIYFYGVTAQAKAMIDRCQVYWARRYVLKRRMPRGMGKGVFISVGGTKSADLFEHAQATVKILFRMIDLAYWGELLVPGVDGKGDIRRHPAALREAYLLGEKLVEPGTPDIAASKGKEDSSSAGPPALTSLGPQSEVDA